MNLFFKKLGKSLESCSFPNLLFTVKFLTGVRNCLLVYLKNIHPSFQELYFGAIVNSKIEIVSTSEVFQKKVFFVFFGGYIFQF